MAREEFKSMKVDIEKDVCRVNGKEIQNASYINLTFEKGVWSLMITEDKFYSTPLATGNLRNEVTKERKHIN